jgi:DNA (cytosine-5)-methyltransferase 1
MCYSTNRFIYVTKWQTHYEAGKYQRVRDERRLVFTSDTSYVYPDHLEGKITVKHVSHIDSLDAFKDEGLTNFYIKDKLICHDIHNHREGCYERLEPVDVQCSQETEQEASLSKYKREVFLSEGPKTNALELFAGGGFLSHGLHMGGNINTKWAIEYEPAPAKLNKRNFPGTIVYVEDVSTCFDRATRQEGESDRTSSNMAASNETDKLGQPVNSMPRKGEVACLICGFPCQDYSGLNHHPKAYAHRNTMICSVLSYIDFYRPSYVLLENVTGLLKHRVCFSAKTHD